MKKISILLFFLVFNITIRAQIVDNFSFSINQVQLTTNNSYTRVAIPSCSYSSEAGNPELPCMVLKYLLPYDQEIVSITVLDSVLQLISNNVLVYPQQPDYPINDTSAHPFVQPNVAVYNNSTPSTSASCLSESISTRHAVGMIPVRGKWSSRDNAR